MGYRVFIIWECKSRDAEVLRQRIKLLANTSEIETSLDHVRVDHGL